MKKRFTATLVKQKTSSGCTITLPFDPGETFGRVKMPVAVTINRFTFRTTTFRMRDTDFVVVNRENRESAGIKAGDRLTVIIEPDTATRMIDPPEVLKRRLTRNKPAREAWNKLSYTHQKEYARWIDEAKREETRARRVAQTIERLLGK